MAQLDIWTRFVRAITAWQARNGHGPVGLSTDPADYVRQSLTDEVQQKWHDSGRCGGGCKFCGPEVRCSSTPPPTKYKTQQCDGQSGHLGQHWFHDGFTRYVWEFDHLLWCGLDIDHKGACTPTWPDGGFKEPEPEPATCGHKRPFEYPGSVTCTLEGGHEGCHSAPYKVEYTWSNDVSWAVKDVWSAIHKEEPVRAVCWAPDQTGTRACDLDDGHHGVHSGGFGEFRESWPPCCCEEHRSGSELCSSCPVHDGPYRTEGLEPPPQPTHGGTEAPKEDLGVIVLRGIIEALTAALKEIE